MKKIIFMLISVIIFFTGCMEINYPSYVEKLKKMGMTDPCINYIIAKLDKKTSEAEKLMFAKSCNNSTVFIFCGGQDGLEKNELKFLKCLTNIK